MSKIVQKLYANQPNTACHELSPRLKPLVAKIQTLGGQGSSFINTPCLYSKRKERKPKIAIKKKPAKKKPKQPV